MLKKTITYLAIGGALLGGVAVAGTAYAGTPAAPTPAVAPATASGHPLHTWLETHRKEIRREGLTISAKTIGVTPKALVAELRSGKSVADVAAQHGVSAQTVVNALVGAADTAVNRAEADHKLTAAQADKIEAALPGRVTKAVDRIR